MEGIQDPVITDVVNGAARRALQDNVAEYDPLQRIFVSRSEGFRFENTLGRSALSGARQFIGPDLHPASVETIADATAEFAVEQILTLTASRLGVSVDEIRQLLSKEENVETGDRLRTQIIGMNRT